MTTTTNKWTAEEYSKITCFSIEDSTAILAATNDNERQHALIVAVSHGSDFASKVAATVLTTGRISAKQADILSEAALEEIFITNDVAWAIGNKIDEKNIIFKNTTL